MKAALLALLVLLSACEGHKEPENPSIAIGPIDEPKPPPTPVEAWLGKWWGSDGLLMEIGQVQDGSFLITIHYPEESMNYTASYEAYSLRFTRRSKGEALHIWEDGERDQTGKRIRPGPCLALSQSEVYCRDPGSQAFAAPAQQAVTAPMVDVVVITMTDPGRCTVVLYMSQTEAVMNCGNAAAYVKEQASAHNLRSFSIAPAYGEMVGDVKGISEGLRGIGLTEVPSSKLGSPRE